MAFDNVEDNAEDDLYKDVDPELAEQLEQELLEAGKYLMDVIFVYSLIVLRLLF